MRVSWMGRWSRAGVLFAAASLVACGVAQERKDAVSPAETPAANETNTVGSAQSTAPAPGTTGQKEARSPDGPSGVQQVLKMVDAGVSKDVIKAYVETAPMVFKPSAEDLIKLKERGVPDDVTMAMLKRGSEQAQSTATQLASAVTANLRNRLYLDPEGYDYFQYYYLYPRTLSSVYGRLGPYSGPYYSGYYGGFAPYSPRYPYFGNRRSFTR